jgi:exo-beta-1,3-glucanase (GH17 family)/cellulose synthase/poly-beta-1,6-N-acetylglucosamine synthase-like glycosyltransferase
VFKDRKNINLFLSTGIIAIPVLFSLLFYVFFQFKQSYLEGIIPRDIPCVSFNLNKNFSGLVSKDQIKESLTKVKQVSNCVRVYSVSSGLEFVPEIAQSLNMDVIVGVWLSQNKQKNEIEINNLISILKNQSNIKMIVVGNETLLMNQLSAEELISYIKLVRQKVDALPGLKKIPITTTETMIEWVTHPELADHVDFVGLHSLAFWQGVASSTPYDAMSEMYLLESYVGKPVVLLEVGWPTNGPNINDAKTGILEQSEYLNFIHSVLSKEGIFYNVIEGLDVSDKARTGEGLIGMHWGILDGQGEFKQIFSFKFLILFISLYLFLISIVFFYTRAILFNKKYFSLSTIFSIVSMATITACTVVVFHQLYVYSFIFYQLVFVLLVIYGFFEISIKFLQWIYSRDLKKDLISNIENRGSLQELKARFGKVAILIAAKDESRFQSIETIKSCLNQTYNDMEVVYFDNNSKDRSNFDYVSNYFKNIDKSKLKLICESKVDGFKAGALNLALKKISPESKYVAVLDSDYVAYDTWIEMSLRYVKPDTGFVQFPQSYDLDRSNQFGDFSSLNSNISKIISKSTTIEQDFVFNVIYPFRAFLGNIIQNGTLVFIPIKYLNKGWPTYSICEDAALGSEIVYQGGKSVYVPLVQGKGMAPNNFKSLKKQRFRWVFGSIQILKYFVTHLRTISLKTSVLYAIDWSNWVMHALYPILFASSFGLVLFVWTIYRHAMFSWPVYVGVFFVFLSLFLFALNYVRFTRDLNPKKSFKEIFFGGTMLILLELSLVNTISSAVFSCIVANKHKFVITRQRFKSSLGDTLSLIGVILASGLGVAFIAIVFYLKITPDSKIILITQLVIVLLPQFVYLRFSA